MSRMEDAIENLEGTDVEDKNKEGSEMMHFTNSDGTGGDPYIYVMHMLWWCWLDVSFILLTTYMYTHIQVRVYVSDISYAALLI